MHKLLMKKLLIHLAVLLGACSVLVAETGISDYTYKDWVIFSDQEKAIYVLGVVSGAYAFASDAIETYGDQRLWDLYKQRVPARLVQEYIWAINLVYSDVRFRTVPIWLILFRLEPIGTALPEGVH